MPTQFSPKILFQTVHSKPCEELQAHREDAWLKVAFSYSLAEMANLGATTEQLSGARNLIQVFQNLWEKGEPERRLPVQTLESYERPLDELIKESKTAATPTGKKK